MCAILWNVRFVARSINEAPPAPGRPMSERAHWLLPSARDGYGHLLTPDPGDPVPSSGLDWGK